MSNNKRLRNTQLTHAPTWIYFYFATVLRWHARPIVSAHRRSKRQVMKHNNLEAPEVQRRSVRMCNCVLRICRGNMARCLALMGTAAATGQPAFTLRFGCRRPGCVYGCSFDVGHLYANFRDEITRTPNFIAFGLNYSVRGVDEPSD